MPILGVFETIYGAGAEMTMNKALLISVVGFGVVFLILSILAVFVKIMGAVFDKIAAGRSTAVKMIPADEPAPAVSGTPLPPDVSAGTLKLTGVSEEEAAVIMAVVSHRSGIPLNRLQFNSIKCTEEQ